MASSLICYLAILSITAATAEQASVEVAADGTVQVPNGDDGLNRRRLPVKEENLNIHLKTANGMKNIVVPSRGLDDKGDPYYELGLHVEGDLTPDKCVVAVFVGEGQEHELHDGAAKQNVYVQLQQNKFEHFVHGLREEIKSWILDSEIKRLMEAETYNLQLMARRTYQPLFRVCGITMPDEEVIASLLQPEIPTQKRRQKTIVFAIWDRKPEMPIYVTCLETKTKTFTTKLVEVPPDGTVQALIDVLKANGIGGRGVDVIGYPYWRGKEYKNLQTPLKDIGIGYKSMVNFELRCYVNVILFGQDLFAGLDDLHVKVAAPDRSLEAFVSALRKIIEEEYEKNKEKLSEYKERSNLKETVYLLPLVSKTKTSFMAKMQSAKAALKELKATLEPLVTKCNVQIPEDYQEITKNQLNRGVTKDANTPTVTFQITG